MRAGFLLVLCVVWPPTAGFAQRAEQLLVVVSCGGLSGGGIVTRADGRSVEVATVKHLVADCAERPLEVTFQGNGTQKWPAQAIYSHGSMDLAIVRVADGRAPRFDSDQFYVIGDSLALQRGDPVQVLAQRLGQPWMTPVRDDVVRYADSDLITIESSTVDRGASGGALVNGQGLIVGMVVRAQPPLVEALPIHRIRSLLQANNLEVRWGAPGSIRPEVAGVPPERPFERPNEVEPRGVAIRHGNIIFEMPTVWRRRPAQGSDMVLHGRIEPPYGPYIILRTGAKLRGEFRAAVDASLAEGNNIVTYGELRFTSADGVRMYLMNEAVIMLNGQYQQKMWYVALNAEDTFDEIVLFTPPAHGPSEMEGLAVLKQLLSTVKLANAERRRMAQ